MSKRTRRPRPAPSAAPAPPRRDPVTRLARFCEFLSLGLVAASFFLNFANDLHRPNAPAVSLDNFPGLLEKSAIVAVHTRTPWVTLALAGMFVSVIAYRKRHAPAPSRIVRFSPLVILLVLALHVAAQAYLQSQGPLNIEIHSAAPPQFDIALSALPGASSIHAITVTRMSVPEGTAQEWSFLFASDVMYSVPILLAWILTYVPKRSLAGPPSPGIPASDACQISQK